MARLIDVARYIIAHKGGRMGPVRLHKLVYYCQGWHLAWEGVPLFAEPIEAWRNGPGIPELLDWHWEAAVVRAEMIPGDLHRVSAPERESIDEVLRTYGRLSTQQLIALARSEEPWLEVRKQGQQVMCTRDIQAYFAKLREALSA